MLKKILLIPNHIFVTLRSRKMCNSFAVLVFLHSSKFAFGRGHTTSSCPRPRASQDLCTPLNQTKCTDHDESYKPAVFNKSRF